MDSCSVNDLHYGSHLHSSGVCMCVCVGVGVSVTVLALLHNAGENNTKHPVTSLHKICGIVTFPFIFIFNLLKPLISNEFLSQQSQMGRLCLCFLSHSVDMTVLY